MSLIPTCKQTGIQPNIKHQAEQYFSGFSEFYQPIYPTGIVFNLMTLSICYKGAKTATKRPLSSLAGMSLCLWTDFVSAIMS